MDTTRSSEPHGFLVALVWPVRSHRAHRDGRHGRGLSRARYPAEPRRRHQDSAGSHCRQSRQTGRHRYPRTHADRPGHRASHCARRSFRQRAGSISKPQCGDVSSAAGPCARTRHVSDFRGGNERRAAQSDGFDQQIRRIAATDNTTSDFDLKSLSPPSDVSGSWIVTLSASPGCRANVPEVAWEREFDVSIIQQDTHLSITRTSPTLVEVCSPGNRPVTEQGRIFGQTLSFGIVGHVTAATTATPVCSIA